MARPSMLTKPWNSTFGSIAILTKQLGITPPHCRIRLQNAPSATTGVSPFFANKGYNPNLEVHPEHELASARARDVIVNLGELHQELRRTITKAQKSYQTSANARRKPAPDFQVGSLAFVKMQYFHTTRPTKKLAEKFLGPFEIISRAGTHSFMLRLPDHMRAVHPIFHVSMLEPSVMIRLVYQNHPDRRHNIRRDFLV
jgi:hypothetical protein